MTRILQRVLTPLAHGSFLLGLLVVLCIFGLYEALEKRTPANTPP